jgi:hypothetical protein
MGRYSLRASRKAGPANTEGAMERAEVVFFDPCSAA